MTVSAFLKQKALIINISLRLRRSADVHGYALA